MGEKDLTFDEYQKQASTTALYPGQGTFIGLAYASLGLNGEAGETGEQVKKIWRDDAADIEAHTHQIVEDMIRWATSNLATPGTMKVDPRQAEELGHQAVRDAFKVPITEERRQKIVKELGDTLWYAAQLATEIGVSLGEVAQINIDKLAARRAADKIHGEGSDR